MQQLQALENQLQQLQTNSLVDDLVAAKLQLAQAQEQTDTLEVQLSREKDKTRRLAAQLTAVESKYAMLYEQQAAAAEAKQQQTATGTPAAAAAAAEQGEGLQIASPTAVGSAIALAAGPDAARRGTYTAGWGNVFMRAGSYMMGAAGSNSAQQQQQQGSVRRVSEPSVVQGVREHSAGHTPRLSAS